MDFEHNYESYLKGFGDMHSKEFWLGLQSIHQLTNNGRNILLEVDLEDVDGNYVSLVFDGFFVTSSDDGYRFKVRLYHFRFLF